MDCQDLRAQVFTERATWLALKGNSTETIFRISSKR